ncbi:APC family permease [Ruminococcus sp. JL13D9]|uniref:APC family permease n=1 Tax=Ruminococcus sp. JL13D9 TaxID=3233381 RepID=UPI00389A9212
MIKIFGKFREKPGMTKYLSMPAVWALSFGCAVGWGAFVMPGTTFLPAAGPWGTVIGLAIGTLIMSAIGVNYYCLMRRYPGPGGSYIYANKILGHDHGFICAWMLLLAYIAVAWANATALSLIVRCLFGDVFCFGFSYEIAGYTVYMGEVLLSFGLISAATLICIFSKRVAKWFQLIFALGLFLLVCACFTAVVLHRGGISGIEPAFAQNRSPVMQVLGIAILGPWAFIGFESISHSSGEFRLSNKKILPVISHCLQNKQSVKFSINSAFFIEMCYNKCKKIIKSNKKACT